MTEAMRLTDWLASMSRRRSTRSAKTPPIMPKKSIGLMPKKPTSATRSGESVSSRTSHASIVICIQRETLENRYPDHSSL